MLLDEKTTEKQLILNIIELCLRKASSPKEFDTYFKSIMHQLRVLNLIPEYESCVEF